MLQAVLGKLNKVRRAGDGFLALCPSHDDRRHSLSVADGDTGVILNCHAGCRTDDVVAAIGISMRDLFYESAPSSSSSSSPAIAAEYEYRDENGKLVYVVERRIPKDFRQRRPDGHGGWIWNLKGVESLPYRLPEVLGADLNEPVFIVEGEKDVDNLHALGFIATCNSGGAGKWKRSHSSYLTGRHVVILPDNDDAGREHATVVAKSLAGVASSIRTIELPGLPAKGDVSDWLASGHSAQELRELLSPVASVLEDRFITVADCEEPEPQRWIIDGWIPEGFVTTLFAHGGSSKSFLSQYMAMCVALGLKVFDHDVAKGAVLFLDGELDCDSWLRRGYMLARGLRLDRIPRGLTYRHVSRSLMDASTRKEIVSFIRSEKPVLTIIDSFTACLPGEDTNSLDDVTSRFHVLSELGTVLVIDHAAKGADMTLTATAIGSVAKMMFSRSALQIASSESGGSVLQHKKSNFGPLADPVTYSLNIGGGLAIFDQIGYTDERLEGVEKALPVAKRIMAAFRGGQFPDGASTKDVADALEVNEKTLRNKINVLRQKGELVHDGRLWRLAPPPNFNASQSSFMPYKDAE